MRNLLGLLAATALAACGSASSGSSASTCGGADLNTDVNNCGSCMNACPSTRTCAAGLCVPKKTYITIGGHALMHPTTWASATPEPAAGAAITLIDPLKQILYPTDPTKSLLATMAGAPAAGAVMADGSWSIAGVDVSDITIAVVSLVTDAPGTTTQKLFPNGSGVVGAPAAGSAWKDKTDATVFGLPLSRVQQLDAALKLKDATGAAAKLGDLGFLYGWVVDSATRPVNCAKLTSGNMTQTVYYPSATLSGATSGASGATAWHGLFVVPSAGSPDIYTAKAGTAFIAGSQAGSAPGLAFSSILAGATAYADPTVMLGGAILKHPAAWASPATPEPAADSLVLTLVNATDDTATPATATSASGAFAMSAADVSKITAVGAIETAGTGYTTTISPAFENRPCADDIAIKAFAVPSAVTSGLAAKLGFSGATALETTGYVLGLVLDASGAPVAGATIISASTGQPIAGTVYPKPATALGDNMSTDAGTGGMFVIPGAIAAQGLVAIKGGAPVGSTFGVSFAGKVTTVFVTP